MSVYCYDHNPQAILADGRDKNYGFKVKTDSHVYYLRCNASRGEYNLYCYAYERNRLEKCFPALAKVKPTPVYKRSINFARANGEENVYQENVVLNQSCAKEIDGSIAHCKDNDNYSLADAARQAIEKYGAERVIWVLATTVKLDFDEVQYSAESVQWEKGTKSGDASGIFYHLKSDPALVNDFISATRSHLFNINKEQQTPQAKLTLAERLEEGKLKAAQQGQNGKNKSKNRGLDE